MLVVAYNIPLGCIGGYYPECNVLLLIWHYEAGSKTPAAKTIPVTVQSRTAACSSRSWNTPVGKLLEGQNDDTART
jgi:hypothetical protein